MLGIRLHQGVQIDLHQGDLVVFASNAVVIPCADDFIPAGKSAAAVLRASGVTLDKGHLPPNPRSESRPVAVHGASLPAAYLIPVVIFPWTDSSRVSGQERKDQIRQRYLQAFASFSTLGLRHVSLAPLCAGEKDGPLDLVATMALETLRSFLDQKISEGMRRVTFVLSGPEEYQIFRKAMFQVFPEDDQE